MSEYIPAELRRQVRVRAAQRSEYCLVHEDDALLPHEPDHIIAVKHHGKTGEANLAWTCFVCNRAKGSDLASIDQDSGEIVRLLNPRVDHWKDHMALEANGSVSAKSNIGRVTISLLKLNRVELLAIRKLLARIGRKPK